MAGRLYRDVAAGEGEADQRARHPRRRRQVARRGQDDAELTADVALQLGVALRLDAALLPLDLFDGGHGIPRRAVAR